jgi:hypothetical protein
MSGGFMSRTNDPVFPPGDIIGAMNCDNRHLLSGGIAALPLCTCVITRKHEHQAEAKKDFTNDFCFHAI